MLCSTLVCAKPSDMHEWKGVPSNIAKNIYILYNVTVKIIEVEYLPLRILISTVTKPKWQSLMQSQSMSNWHLLNNSTGGDWTTFHAHMQSLVATFMELFVQWQLWWIVSKFSQARCTEAIHSCILLKCLWNLLPWFQSKPLGSGILCDPSPLWLCQSHPGKISYCIYTWRFRSSVMQSCEAW